MFYKFISNHTNVGFTFVKVNFTLNFVKVNFTAGILKAASR